MLHTNTLGSPSITSAAGAKSGASLNPGTDVVNTNPMVLNFAGAVAGGATVALGVLVFMNVTNLANPLIYTMHIFYLFLGVVIVVSTLFSKTKAGQWIYSQANFLSHPSGCGLLFLYLGCVMTASGATNGAHWLYLTIGICMLLLAVTSLVIGWRRL